MNELQIFNSSKFGDIRTVEVNGKTHFVASDVAKALGYVRPNDAISAHCRCTVKCRIPHPQSKSASIEVNVIPEGDIYRLVANSELPTAPEFESWIFDEVLPTLRKTGTYSLNPAPNLKQQEVEARLRNAKVRESNQYLKIAAQINIPEYKYILQSKAAETLAGAPILPMQEVERKSHTATEIGDMFGVSSQRIGKLANANGLKTPEYGMEVWDKSPYSAKQIPSWRYYESAIPVFRRLLSQETVSLEAMKGGVAQ